MSQNKTIIKDLTGVIKFEQWMRFYFIKKVGDDLVISPETTHMEKIKALYNEYYDLATTMDQTTMTPEVSQRLVVNAIREQFEGSKYSATQIHKTMDSKAFSMELYLFNTWIELHKDQLSEVIIGYSEWIGLYETWKNSEQGQKVLMSMDVANNPASNASETVH